jgi:2,4-dienoyl-CoA reductase-like NADH-dependent reductase (Old Yellow Enzyme family)
MKAKNTLDNTDFIIGYRFSPEENHTPGITLEDTRFLIDRLCSTDLDYLHISLGDYKQTSIRGEEVHVLKSVVDMVDGRKPFIGVGSVYKKHDAEDLLNYGVDLVAIGRQLLIDPETVEKWQNNEIPYSVFDPSNETLEIPEPLKEVIVSNPGWVPM